jgi:hypothetical protein
VQAYARPEKAKRAVDVFTRHGNFHKKRILLGRFDSIESAAVARAAAESALFTHLTRN